MTERRARRWFQLSLKSLFLLTLVVAAFFAGYSLATRQAEGTVRAEREAREKAEEERTRIILALLAKQGIKGPPGSAYLRLDDVGLTPAEVVLQPSQP
jgi:hypothetical protein